MANRLILERVTRCQKFIHSKCEYGHGAFGEPDNRYEDYVHVYNSEGKILSTERVFDSYFLLHDDKHVYGVFLEGLYGLEDAVRRLVDSQYASKEKAKRYEQYLKLKEEFETK